MFLERARPHLRRHVRRPSLRGAVLGQRHRAVPGRRAHQHRLPLPRAAVGHRGRGLGLHALPEPVQRRVHGPRRARRARAARATTTTSTTAGCATRAAGATSRSRSEERITQPLRPRRRAPAPGDVGAGARRRRPRASRKAGAASRALVGGPDHQRGGLPAPAHLPRGARLAATSTRAPAARSRRRSRAGSRTPDLAAAVARHRPRLGRARARDATRSNEAPIFDLRLRKAVRRFGARLVVASSAPTALDGGATEVLRFAPGAAEALLRALQKALLESENGAGEAAARNGGAGAPAADESGGALPGHAGAGASSSPTIRLERARRASAEVDTQDLRDAAALLTQADNVVVVWGERLGLGERGAGALSRADRPGAAAGPRRGRRLGADRGPGRRPTAAACARSAACRDSARALPDTPIRADARRQARDCRGEVKAFYLLHSDPLRELPGQRAVGRGARRRPSFVVAHAAVPGRVGRAPRRRRLPGRVLRREGGHASRIPTAASSACGPRSGTPARCGWSGRCWLDLAAGSVSTCGGR